MILSRESLIAALCEAAEIEHSITCQYLFAAFTLKVHPNEGGVDWPRLERIRSWKTDLLRIARQEMMHHGLVCNLLLAIGGAPHFRRADFPLFSQYLAPDRKLELLPFSDRALERFASYERPSPPPGSGAGEPVETIDGLYREIREGLVRVHRSNRRLFNGPLLHQITNAELSTRPGQFDIDLMRVDGLESALAVVDRVRSHDHEERLQAIHRELDELVHRDPLFAPARPVVANPRVRPPSGGGEGVVLIQHPLTLATAELFNAAYEAMVLMLSRLFGRVDETTAEADVLTRTAFFPLMTMVLRPLGELLTRMPVAEGSTATAGACFEFPFALPLPTTRRSAWIFIHERLLEMAAASARLTSRLREASVPWGAELLPRLQLLEENLERIAGTFGEQMGLHQAQVQQLLGRLSRQ
jgi:hypothetical protein